MPSRAVAFGAIGNIKPHLLVALDEKTFAVNAVISGDKRTLTYGAQV